MSTRLVYVADAMCSWCWGFSPVLETVRARFELPVELIVGGLRPGGAAQRMDDGMRSYLRGTWGRISELTSQPFDFAPLDWKEWVYDTELPARAVVAMRQAAPDLELALFQRLQRAFYAEGVDVTSPDVYPELVEPLGVEPDGFGALLASDAVREATWQDFARARAMGVTGFPALLLVHEQTASVLTLGYRPVEAIAPLVGEALGRGGA